MNRDFSHYKEDIINSCLKINEYIKVHTFESFLKDSKTYDAVLMNFAIIGEASNHFSEEIRLNNKDINWRAIIAMRNFLIHEYFEIDPIIVWKTSKEDIPILLTKFNNIELS